MFCFFSFVYSTINVATLSGEYLNSKVGATFIYPYEGDQPARMDVKFIINGKEYGTTTDKNGYASVDADLPVGTHTITIVTIITVHIINIFFMIKRLVNLPFLSGF